MAQAKTILIVDDDTDLRGLLCEQLELHEEFAATEAPTPLPQIATPRSIDPEATARASGTTKSG